jgi:hypothetical protein
VDTERICCSGALVSYRGRHCPLCSDRLVINVVPPLLVEEATDMSSSSAANEGSRTEWKAQAQAIMDGKAKPPGSLGQLEDLGIRWGWVTWGTNSQCGVAGQRRECCSDYNTSLCEEHGPWHKRFSWASQIYIFGSLGYTATWLSKPKNKICSFLLHRWWSLYSIASRSKNKNPRFQSMA